MSTHDRTGRPEQVSAPAMRRVIKLIDMAIENGNLDPQDRDEVIKMFLSDPKVVVDNKAMGGMMSINDMITPVSYKMGTREGDLVGDKEKGITSIKIGLMEDTGDLNILGMKLILQEAADTLEEMDKIEKMSSKEIIKMFENFMGKQGT
tara:strand:- start:43 stop:489 length:447 start_codon:yes stop_codon:yes gene_type:complete